MYILDKSFTDEYLFQSLQDKQGNLVQRLDDLDRENVEIRDQVSELEEEKENLETSLERAQEEKRVLQKQLTDEKVCVFYSLAPGRSEF